MSRYVSQPRQNAKAAFMAAKLIWDKSEEPKEASSYAQKAVEADPKNPEVHVLLARIMEHAGMKAIAIPHWLTERHDLSGADLTVAHAGELTLERLSALVK